MTPTDRRMTSGSLSSEVRRIALLRVAGSDRVASEPGVARCQTVVDRLRDIKMDRTRQGIGLGTDRWIERTRVRGRLGTRRFRRKGHVRTESWG